MAEPLRRPATLRKAAPPLGRNPLVPYMPPMQTNAPFFDDVAKLMTSAVGMAQAAGEEAKAAVRSQADRWSAELDLVRREEMDAALDVLRAEIVALRAEVAALRGAPLQA